MIKLWGTSNWMHVKRRDWLHAFLCNNVMHLSGFSCAVFNLAISTSWEWTKMEKHQVPKWVKYQPPLRSEMRVCDSLLQRTIFSQTGEAYKFRAGEPRSPCLCEILFYKLYLLSAPWAVCITVHTNYHLNILHACCSNCMCKVCNFNQE